jgi:hypothetical protein
VDVDSVEVCRAVRGIARGRLVRHIETVSEATMGQIEKAITVTWDSTVCALRGKDAPRGPRQFMVVPAGIEPATFRV